MWTLITLAIVLAAAFAISPAVAGFLVIVLLLFVIFGTMARG